MNPAGRPVNDELANLGLLLIAALAVVAGVLRIAGSIAAWLTLAPQPRSDVGGGLRVLADPLDPSAALGSPGLPAVAFWAVVAVLLLACGAGGWFAWRQVTRLRHRSAHAPRRLAGIATAHDIKAAASERALLRRARTLRPSLTKPTARDVGYLIGRSRGHDVWISVEDSTLLLGPPGQAKASTWSSTRSSTHREP